MRPQHHRCPEQKSPPTAWTEYHQDPDAAPGAAERPIHGAVLVLDEAAVRRVTGRTEVMRQQLHHPDEGQGKGPEHHDQGHPLRAPVSTTARGHPSSSMNPDAADDDASCMEDIEEALPPADQEEILAYREVYRGARKGGAEAEGALALSASWPRNSPERTAQAAPARLVGEGRPGRRSPSPTNSQPLRRVSQSGASCRCGLTVAESPVRPTLSWAGYQPSVGPASGVVDALRWQASARARLGSLPARLPSGRLAHEALASLLLLARQSENQLQTKGGRVADSERADIAWRREHRCPALMAIASKSPILEAVLIHNSRSSRAQALFHIPSRQRSWRARRMANSMFPRLRSAQAAD